jgi:hypothetical protein
MDFRILVLGFHFTLAGDMQCAFMERYFNVFPLEAGNSA